ncbi:MAG: hypothetical protein NT076_02180 [Candidatus Pacearchaeota archaeon]|nr:hypothetical protein [Candidatus Pacearchaeota archaeon]
MIIPLNVKYKERLMPNILVNVFGSHAPSSILVVIDTGSDITILSHKDALQLQVPTKGMAIIKNVSGISRGTLALCQYNKKLIFYLKKEDQTSLKIEMDNLYVSVDPLACSITIIGMDLLKNNNLRLFYDPQGEAYLEKLD